MVQDFCDEPYDDMPYGTLLFLFYFDPLPLTLGTWSRSDPDVGDPGGVGVYVNRGKAPEGRPRGLEIPLHNHPGGVDLLITQRFFHHST
jgi:hypothetical protein